MEMDFKNITFYPEFFVDLAIYVGVGVVLVLVSKWLWERREERRMKKEMAEYIQQKEDEE